MLTYTPMKKLAGIRLEGDYLTLQRLHETLLKFANATPSQPKNDLLFELGYDIRHAFEGTRDVIAPPEHTPEIGARFGVNIIWPTLLLQARQLRTALAWAPSNSDDHAAVFDLESVIERAIADVFRLNADDVLDRWRRIDPIAPGVGEALDPLGAMFCSWTGATRATRIGALLAAFSSMHSTYHDIATQLGRDSISPAEIASWRGRNWSDPEKVQ